MPEVRRRSHLVFRGLDKCDERCFHFVPDSVCFCGSLPTSLAGEGLVIPTGPCSRGSPAYFLKLGARRRGSSVSDGLRRRLWRHVLSKAVRASVTISSNPSGSSDLWAATRLSGPLGRVREVESLQWYQSEESTEICKEVITIAVPKKVVSKFHGCIGGTACPPGSDGLLRSRTLRALPDGGLVCGFPASFVCALQWVAAVAVSLAWRVWSFGVFVPWRRGWRWTRWQWFSLCGGRLQASPDAVLLVVFGAFECVCVAKAERACVWCGLHRSRVVTCGTGGRCPCLVGCPSVVAMCAVLVMCGLLLSVRGCALCSAWLALLLELSRCSVCHVASLVEHCDTCLWLLSAWC
ncbi:hypothetical protein Taro_036076 [Colocasia esculenta]|uniref:Uncharacterized protein n=1 Tax=Colocasia esculenta TaxID=4460 RepID=A0A843W246_COLES|nr:hypothetical protein [Colocasia esculenta]